MKSTAYPNFDYWNPINPQRDLNKWMKTARELYFQVHKGANRQQAFEKMTQGWDKTEVLDFQHWLHFYEENGNNKYKEAQVMKTAQQYWTHDSTPGYFLPVQQDKQSLEEMRSPITHPDIIAEQQAQEKKERIKLQRAKVIGRLDSAEKLLRSEEGQELTGDQHDQIIRTLFDLKQQIMRVNKISTSVRLYQNMIIREANIMVSKGYKEASNFLTKIAQELPSVQEPANPAQIGEGQAGTLPGQAPGQVEPPSGDLPIDVQMPDKVPGVPDNAVPQAAALPSEPISPGMKEFLEGLDSGGKSFDEEDEEKDLGSDDDFIVEAQAQLQPMEPTENLEVAEDPEVAAGRDFDKLLDQTFSNITIADVVSKLEDVAKILKTREIPRQLAVVDMMLDRLGLATFFPTLSEATNKSLESNNYMLTRIEDVLAKLSGALTTKEIDLKNDSAPPPSPMAQNLQQQEDQEKAKKKMRKEIEEQKLMNPVKPEPTINMNEDLAQPAQVVQPETPAPPPTPAPTI